MITFHIYRGVGAEHETLRADYIPQGTLESYLSALNITLPKNHSFIILSRGYEVKKTDILKDGDVIFIRHFPGLVTAAIVLTAVAVAVGVVLGVVMGVMQAKQKKQMENAEKSAKKSAESVEKLPFVKGAGNALATGRTLPYIIGRTFFAPYKLSGGYYTISGDNGANAFYNVALAVGFQPLEIDEVRIKNTVIFKGEATTGQFRFEKCQYSGSGGNYIDIRRGAEFQKGTLGDLSDLNKKIVSNYLMKEIPNKFGATGTDATARDEGVIVELPANALSVEAIVQYDGCRRFVAHKDGSSDWKWWGIGISAEWTDGSVNSEGELIYHAFDTGFPTGPLFSSHTLRYSAKVTIPFQYRDKTLSIRLKRLSPQAEQGQDTAYLLYVQTTVADPNDLSQPQKILDAETFKKLTIIGVHVEANGATDGTLDEINVRATGMARNAGTLYRSQGSASVQRVASLNPADWVLELLTSPIHKPSEYALSEIDLASFSHWRTYCERCGFGASGAITEGKKKEETISALLGNGFATLTRNVSGKLEVAVDEKEDYPVALLNSEKIINIKLSKQFKRLPDGIRVKFINEEADYSVDTVTVMFDGGVYEPEKDTLTELSTSFITNPKHAYKYAWRKLAEMREEVMCATVEVGREGVFYPLYSKVLVSHRVFSLGVGVGSGEIKKFALFSGGIVYRLGDALTGGVSLVKGAVFEVNSESGLEDGSEYALTVEAVFKVEKDGAESYETKILDVLATYLGGKHFTLGSGKIELVSTGGLVSLERATYSVTGKSEVRTLEMKIKSEEQSDRGVTLNLVNYSDHIFDMEGAIPTFKTNITPEPDNTTNTIEKLRTPLQAGDVFDIVKNTTFNVGSAVAKEVAEVLHHGVHFTELHKIPNYEWSMDDIIKKIDEDTREMQDAREKGDESVLLDLHNESGSLRVLITGTEEGLRTLISDTDHRLQANITETAGEIRETITENVGAINAELANTNSNLDKAKEDIVENASAIVQNSNEIKTLVKRDTYNADKSEIETSLSTLDQKADRINLAVQSNKASISSNAGKIEKNKNDLAETTAGLELTRDAFQSYVRGGGAEGQMTLSLAVPAVITLSQYDNMESALLNYIAGNTLRGITKYTEGGKECIKVNGRPLGNIYTAGPLIPGTTENYIVQAENVSALDIQTLNEALRECHYLASQIHLEADQILVDGTTTFESKIRDNLNENFEKLGLSTELVDNQTVISGGFINTAYIDADALDVEHIVIKNGNAEKTEAVKSLIDTKEKGVGFIVSSNFREQADDVTTGTSSFKVPFESDGAALETKGLGSNWGLGTDVIANATPSFAIRNWFEAYSNEALQAQREGHGRAQYNSEVNELTAGTYPLKDSYISHGYNRYLIVNTGGLNYGYEIKGGVMVCVTATGYKKVTATLHLHNLLSDVNEDKQVWYEYNGRWGVVNSWCSRGGTTFTVAGGLKCVYGTRTEQGEAGVGFKIDSTGNAVFNSAALFNATLNWATARQLSVSGNFKVQDVPFNILALAVFVGGSTPTLDTTHSINVSSVEYFAINITTGGYKITLSKQPRIALSLVGSDKYLPVSSIGGGSYATAGAIGSLNENYATYTLNSKNNTATVEMVLVSAGTGFNQVMLYTNSEVVTSGVA